MTSVGANHDFAPLTGGRTHFVTAGRGSGIVLLRGWPGLWFDYREVLPLAARIGRCVAPNFFGFGDSDPPSGDPVDSAAEESFARDILELFDAIELEDAVIVGRSEEHTSELQSRPHLV